MSTSEQNNCDAVAADGFIGWDSLVGVGEPSWGIQSDADPAADNPMYGWDRESRTIYSREMCLAALQGDTVPDVAAGADVDTLSHAVKMCILRGIRHHHGFGTELMQQHHAGPDHASFRRALHARAIMSNAIPDMDFVNDASSVPYCIWYPDVASEETYRELARRYPQMRYHVGRACAVAGYSALYKELGLLPDLSIAEEAQDTVMRSQRGDTHSPTGSAEIFQQIVQQPVRWHVMNDYARTVELVNPMPARHGLNGDTAVISTLQLKRSFQLIRHEFNRFYDDKDNKDNNCLRLEPPTLVDEELAPCYFNITEDWNIDEYTSSHAEGEGTPAAKRPESEAMLELLWNPLPFDLPWGDKDLLILMAAYHGDVDRYARLRRPHQQHVSRAERNCIVRGIYHSTGFARWCSIHLEPLATRYKWYYQNAITARFIMSNDLSRIKNDNNSTPVTNNDDDDDDDDDDTYPRQIWYPTHAARATYLELARRQPAAMILTVARAVVHAGYRDLWDELLLLIAERVQKQPEAARDLVDECRANPNRHYLDSLRGSGIDVEGVAGPPSSSGSARTPSGEGWSTEKLPRVPRVDHVQCCDDYQGEDGEYYAGQLYDGVDVDVSEVELFIAAPKEMRPPAGFDHVDLKHLYAERRRGGGSDHAGGDGDESRAYRRGRWEFPGRRQKPASCSRFDIFGTESLAESSDSKAEPHV